MSTIAFIWEIFLLSSLIILLFMMQDWSKFRLFKKYVEEKQRKKDELEAEKLLDELPKGVIRYKKKESSKK